MEVVPLLALEWFSLCSIPFQLLVGKELLSTYRAICVRKGLDEEVKPFLLLDKCYFFSCAFLVTLSSCVVDPLLVLSIPRYSLSSPSLPLDCYVGNHLYTWKFGSLQKASMALCRAPL